MASKIGLTPYLGNATRATPDRCKQRWNDLQFVQMDSADTRWVTSGLIAGETMSKVIRERFILYVQCIESKPGQEPTQPYLYEKSH